MTSQKEANVAIVIAVGPGKEAVLDTLESIETFCPEPHRVILIEDQTQDGTYEALLEAKRPHWDLIRNTRRCGWERGARAFGFGFEQALDRTECGLILKMDVDALIIKPGVLSDAVRFLQMHPDVGMFGVYETDYNRARDFSSHQQLLARETAWYRVALGLRPSWRGYLAMAEKNGYKRGENVFGGAYFLSRPCAEAMRKINALRVPWRWHSALTEDVYFSMVARACGFRLAHFAAPDGPLCMEWRGLPFSARELEASKFKLVHSVDKGPNTGPAENGGRTARDIFRELRTNSCEMKAMLPGAH